MLCSSCFSRVLTCLLLAALCGCASPGVPRPPSLRLPEKATDLRAERVGGEVRLSWTVPNETTDHGGLRGVTTAEVCRGLSGARCTPVKTLAVTAGPVLFADVLPGPLRVGANAPLEYRVELKNDRGRSAGASDPALAASGRAPETPAGLAGVGRREGVLVTWAPETGGAPDATVELHRTGGAVGGGAAGTKGSKEGPKREAPANPPGGATGAADGAVVLVAEAKEGVNGMVDRSARDGEGYTYVAERVRTVKLAGESLALRSGLSGPVTVAVRDVFPPQAPRGLVTVPGGGFGAAASVDLSWAPSEEDDVVGYRVYRSVDGGKAVLLTTALVLGPAYGDLQVAAGHTYGYRVTAVDVHGNESRQGTEVRESLR